MSLIMKSNIVTLFSLCLLMMACDTTTKNEAQEEPITNENNLSMEETLPVFELDIKEANRLAQLPFECMETEYPNKLNQVLNSAADLKSPSQLHPAFYGCFDWHSAVHGHWSLVALLKQYPALDNAAEIRTKLATRITKENIEQEIIYFKQPQNQSFERTYGWAWLLQLALELHEWDDPLARELETNLQPLTDVIVQNYIDFYPKLYYPLRIGTHNNTAFGMSFAYDYAQVLGQTELKAVIEKTAKRFFMEDKNGPLSWEPDGFDFLSPCLEEVNIMRKVLSKEVFEDWLNDFLPQLSEKTFDLEEGIVTDREDGHLVHLDGLNFSRAWCLTQLAQNHAAYHHLQRIASKHIAHSLPTITDGHYEGGHWLASFAIYALLSQPK